MKKLLDLFETYKKHIETYKIIIVANVRRHTGNFKSMVLNKANPIEFFSDEEFDEICKAILSLKIFTKIYYNELDFIEDVLKEKYDVKKIIVINFARNGVVEGKKSLIPSFCDLLNIKYTTSNAFIQSLCRDKFVWSCVLQQSSLPSLNSVYINENCEGLAKLSEYGKYIVKPKAESSSINVSEPLAKQDVVSFAKNNQGKYIAQKFLCGNEIEVPFYELEGHYYMQEPAQINYSGNILFENLSEENNYYYSSCKFSGTEILKIQETAKNAAKILGIKKYGRIDFKFDENGNAFIIDIATLPYLTENSSFAFSAKNQNFEYVSIFKILLTIAYLSN